jgi:hypothetical protein
MLVRHQKAIIMLHLSIAEAEDLEEAMDKGYRTPDIAKALHEAIHEAQGKWENTDAS